MTPVEGLSLALGGLPLGAMYALQAMGIVLVHKTSGVFNFAQGAIGMTAAFLASWFGLSLGLPTVLAVVLAVVAGAGIGVVIERLTIRPVEGALQRTIVTLAWLLGLQGLMQLAFGTRAGREWVALFPDSPALVVDTLKLAWSWDQVGVMVLTAAVALGLGAWFRTRPFGMAMRAVADAPEGASLLGIPVNRVTMVSWALGAGMAALGGILVTPLLATLDTVALAIFTIQALAAAVIGRLTSLPLTLAGGLALGMVQPVAKRLLDLPVGSDELVAFAFIVGALLLRRRTGRGDVGDVGWAPTGVGSLPRGRAAVVAVVAVVAFPLLVAGLFDPGSLSRYVAVTFIWALPVLSLVLLTGVAGQVSLCQAVFMGVGGYGAALAVGAGVPFLLALLVGGLLAAVAAAVVGLPALRLRGLELAIVTLSLAFAADRYFFQAFEPLVGPDRRRPLPRPEFADRLVDVGGADTGLMVTDWRPYAVLTFVVFVLAAWGVASLRRGRLGAAFTALRSSEAAASAMGFSVTTVKLKGFALSGFVAGLGGALFGGLNELAGNTAFMFDRSITLLAYAVIAGIGSVPGAVVGGLIVTLQTVNIGGGDGQVASDTGLAVTTILTATLLIAVLIAAPRGLAGVGGWTRRRLRRQVP